MIVDLTNFRFNLIYNLNNILAITIGKSLNKLVYSFKPRSILDFVNAKKERIDYASTIAKIYYNDKYIPTEFEKDNIVRLFKIVYRVDSNTYKLDFSAS
ncbi:hypothetical protein C8A01DRAFT_51647 [Parachaetomium inaequale]|uniref:Uncharacterized protein n=1 Tax=Parachaetomium inaequale TaxID=2588326 RepID=A0AAN6P5J3_9PEZI|nr:hypothetical protein C8A01DRAFT_51647 [Parachaetomium inaequale]